jgi:hypothetical protein
MSVNNSVTLGNPHAHTAGVRVIRYNTKEHRWLDEVQGKTKSTNEAYSIYDEEGIAVLTMKFANKLGSCYAI